MIRLYDVLDGDELAAALDAGLVSARSHPQHPYTIYNYTPKAQFERAWTDVTRRCRGLIVHDYTGEVLARPFEKFFNLGEDSAGAGAGDFEVRAKLDGSLGILYPLGDGEYAVATRGSFDSAQARHATTLWRERYAHRFVPVAGWTYLFEIVYPENRVVVDYGDLDDLVLVAVVDNRTGKDVALALEDSLWPGPVAAVETFTGLDQLEALACHGDGTIAEGYVVRFKSGLRLKVKYADYLRLHRLVTGVSARTIWELLRDGRGVDELLECAPDEFHGWVSSKAEEFRAEFAKIESASRFVVNEVRGLLPDRKAVAAHVQRWALWPGVVFRMLDGKDYSAAIWRQLRPAAETPLRTEKAA